MTKVRTPVKRAKDYKPFKIRWSEVPRRNTPYASYAPGQDDDGYGMKISTDYQVQFEGSKRWLRIYLTQISNAGSAWVEIDGEKYFFNDGDFHEAQDQRRAALIK